MRKLILSVLLFLTSLSSYGYEWKVHRPIDGDTVSFFVDFLPVELGNTISVRIQGVDTPEKPPRAKCPAEAIKAKAASEFTKSMISQATHIDVVVVDWDKYGGRVLGDIFVDGMSLKQLLLTSGHARPYDGGTKGSWCQ